MLFYNLGASSDKFVIEKYGNQCYYAITDPQTYVQCGAYEMGYRKMGSVKIYQILIDEKCVLTYF